MISKNVWIPDSLRKRNTIGWRSYIQNETKEMYDDWGSSAFLEEWHQIWWWLLMKNRSYCLRQIAGRAYTHKKSINNQSQEFLKTDHKNDGYFLQDGQTIEVLTLRHAWPQDYEGNHLGVWEAIFAQHYTSSIEVGASPEWPATWKTSPWNSLPLRHLSMNSQVKAGRSRCEAVVYHGDPIMHSGRRRAADKWMMLSCGFSPHNLLIIMWAANDLSIFKTKPIPWMAISNRDLFPYSSLIFLLSWGFYHLWITLRFPSPGNLQVAPHVTTTPKNVCWSKSPASVRHRFVMGQKQNILGRPRYAGPWRKHVCN